MRVLPDDTVDCGKESLVVYPSIGTLSAAPAICLLVDQLVRDVDDPTRTPCNRASRQGRLQCQLLRTELDFNRTLASGAINVCYWHAAGASMTQERLLLGAELKRMITALDCRHLVPTTNCTIGMRRGKPIQT